MAPASVFGFLSGSPHARTPGALDLGFGRSAALWRNENDHITYDGAEGHTFSLYLEGGSGTRRVDGRPVSGWPDAFCVMPHQYRSEWEITAPFGFVHLYLPAAELRRSFAETFDRDARLLDVAEVTFADAPRLAPVLRSIARAVATNAPLAAEAAMTEMIALFLADPRWGGLRRRALTGGLAPHLGRRIAEHVEAHLHETIRLADLAAVAGLSPYHLQRAFRASRGCVAAGVRRAAPRRAGQGTPARPRPHRRHRLRLRLQQPEPFDAGVPRRDRGDAWGVAAGGGRVRGTRIAGGATRSGRRGVLDAAAAAGAHFGQCGASGHQTDRFFAAIIERGGGPTIEGKVESLALRRTNRLQGESFRSAGKGGTASRSGIIPNTKWTRLLQFRSLSIVLHPGVYHENFPISCSHIWTSIAWTCISSARGCSLYR